MTIFGPDISSYEHGLNISGLTDSFVIAKVTEGTYYRDADWPAFRDAARRAGKILVGYHFVTGEDPRAQAANLAGWIGDKGIPVMLDFEPTGSSRPTHAQQLAVADAVNAAGMRTRLSYTPRWYWQQIGSPDLTGLTARGIGVVSSNYPNTSITDPPRDYAADGGDSGPGWAPYGGITPLLWQFTDAGVEQQRMDFNAFRGTAAELAAFLGSTPTTGGTMSDGNIPPAISATWPPLAGTFPAGSPYTTADQAVWANAGARAAGIQVAALDRKVDQVRTDLGAKLDQLLARPSAPPVDLAALEAFIVEHQTAGTAAADFAAALIGHLDLKLSAK